MRRILLLMSVAALLVVMAAVTASPAFAQPFEPPPCNPQFGLHPAGVPLKGVYLPGQPPSLSFTCTF